MAVVAGYNATVKEGSTTIQDISSFDLPFKMDMLETTAFSGSGGATVGTKTFLPGLLGLQMKLTGNWNKGDTGQAALETAFFGRTTVSIVVSPNGSNTYTLTAYVSDYDIKGDVKGMVTVDYSLMMTGNVTLA